jgi:hypothetical protein
LAVTGAQDDNTLSEFAKRWVETARAKGVNARFEEISGLNHSTILQWPDIASRVSQLIEAANH